MKKKVFTPEEFLEDLANFGKIFGEIVSKALFKVKVLKTYRGRTLKRS